MAHGYLDYFGGQQVDVRSAGIETHGVNLKAIAIMQEDGVDISHHTSNNVNEYANEVFDYIITVCDNAKENCPYFPATVKTFHQNFSDPAKAIGSEEEVRKEFRKVRDQIKEYSQSFIQTILSGN
jgi:arsenate reductase